jgi:WD40 repeat protein
MNPNSPRSRFKWKEMVLLGAPLLLFPALIVALQWKNSAAPELQAATTRAATSREDWPKPKGRTITSESIGALAFSPDRQILATSDRIGRVKWWDARRGTLRKKLAMPRKYFDNVMVMAYSRDGRTLGLNLNRSVVLFDGRSAQFIRALQEPPKPGAEERRRQAYKVLLESSRKALKAPSPPPPGATPGTRPPRKTRATPLPTSTPMPKEMLMAMQTRVLKGLAFSPNGKTVAAGAAPTFPFGQTYALEGAVCLWEVGTGRLKASLPVKVPQVDAVAISPDGKWLAVQSWSRRGKVGEGVVQLWNLATLKKKWETDVAGMGEDVCFSPDGQWIAVGGIAPTALSTASGEVLSEMIGLLNGASARKMRFAAGGEMLIGGGQFAPLGFWNVSDGEVAVANWKKAGSFGAIVDSFALSRDGQRMAYVNDGGKVEMWDVSGLKGDVTAKPGPLSKPRRLWTIEKVESVRGEGFRDLGKEIGKAEKNKRARK